jgi:hypothetical protein
MKLPRKSIFRLSLLLPFLFLALTVWAQSDPTGLSAPTRTYAITNATIIPSPGAEIKAATIIISNGLITAIGTDVAIPGNAQMIDGTDLYIYPGFIDGMSYTGAKRPENPERPDNLFTPDPPNFYAGITPELSVLGQLDGESNSISNLRKAGFTMSHTVPYGRMLPGTGSLIFLNDATHPDEILYAENVSMYTQFTGAPGAYPGNTLGIMAKWRNLYRNAALAKNNAELYASNPTGLTRPTQDRVLQAFYPVVEQLRPVFYNADEMLEAQRAIKLKNQLGFKLALGNLTEAWPMADALKGSDVTVFLSLDLPDEPEVEEDEDKSDEVIALEQRRQEFYERQMRQFHLYDSLGIKFGFSTIDANANNIHKNLIRLGEFGLDSTKALAALTINAAELLGLSEVTGTLEVGKIGNVMVANGPYFKKGSDIKFLFVDGNMYEYEIKEGGGSNQITEEASSSVIGIWDYAIASPQGEQVGTFVFTNEDGMLSGIMTSNDGTPDVDLSNVSFVEGTLTFEFSFEGGGQSVEVVVTGDIIGTEYNAEATISVFNMSFPFSAVKQTPN